MKTKLTTGACLVLVLAGVSLTACASTGGGSNSKIGSTITIPYLASNTGPAAANAADVRVGAQLAVEDANRDRPKGAPQIKIKYYDSAMDPKQAIANYRTAVGDDPAIVVGSFSNESAAVAPLANSAKIPFVAAFSSVISIATSNRPWAFAMTPDITTLVSSGVRDWLANKSGVTKVGMIEDEQDVASTTQGSAAIAAVRSDGHAIGSTVKYQTGATDFAPIVAKALNGSPSALIVAGLPSDAAAIVKQIHSTRPGVSVFLVQSSLGTGFYSNVGSASAGAYGVTTYYLGEATPRLQSYTKRFEAKSGGVAPTFGFAYESWRLIAAAIQKASISGKSVSAARDAIQKALLSVTVPGLEGGEIGFNSMGYAPHKPVLLKMNGGTSVTRVKANQ